jgi:hypothetical protein
MVFGGLIFVRLYPVPIKKDSTKEGPIIIEDLLLSMMTGVFEESFG